MSIKEAVIGSVMTIAIGGTAYTISTADVVDNFAADTGLTQQQAEQYVNSVTEDDLSPFYEIGTEFIDEGNTLLENAKEIDCVNYIYDWESPTLSCDQGKSQLTKFANDGIALGRSYRVLDSENSTRADIARTISLIDELNADYGFEIVEFLLTSSEIRESKNSNSYNKATLQAALNSE